MASCRAKTIEEIDDLSEMFQAMTALNINCKGLKTLDEMKAKVKEELNASEEKPDWTAGQAFSVLTEARDGDVLKRQTLLKLCSDTMDCVKQMDDKILALLQRSLGNIEEKIEHHQAQLKRKEYYLLVAGETGSGKSSLVNLILGEILLPHSVLSTTSTICEMRYGVQPRIVAHFKDKDPETGLPVREFQLKAATSEQSYLQQISPFVHVKSDREKGSIYKKVELFWPHQLLKKGVVIIDSPGIGESDIMDEIVTQYLPQAFAFIYVINSANAGGVQKDRLEKLLDEVRKVTLKGQKESVSSQCALFVCNKWDQVPEQEVKEVQNHVIKKLKKCWPGLHPESQIVFMSTQNTSIAQNHGIITEEFFSLMSAMKSMVLKSIEARLEMHWKWLDYSLSRIVFQAKAFVMNASRDQDEVATKMALILFRLKRIDEKQAEVVEELHNYLKSRVRKAVQKLRDYLTSDDVKNRFSTWTLDEVPKAESSWEVTKSNIAKALNNRLREIIDNWEEDTQVFLNARQSLLRHFQQRYNFVEGQLRNLQGVVTDDDVDISESIPADERFTVAQKVVIGVTSPLWVPLTLVALVIGAPVVGILSIKGKIEERSKIKKYERNKCAFMAETAADYLDDVTDERVLKGFVKEQLKEAKVCLKQIEAHIPELIEADKMIFRQLVNEGRSKEEIKELYQPIMDDASDIRGHLAVFALKEIRTIDISSEKLDWKEDKHSRLGCGAFATVYEGKMRRQGKEQTVALKVCGEVLDSKNASLIMAEVELLRRLEDLLAHVSHHIGIYLMLAVMSHQQTEKWIKRVVSRMEELKISQERKFDELSQHQLQTFEAIIAKLVAHFKSEETIKKFCDWSLQEVPKPLATWQETKSEALKYVSERTHQFVQQWEDDEHEFEKAQASLIQYCTKKYDVMSNEIHKVENQALLEETEADVSQNEEVAHSTFREVTAPTWLRQGLVSVVVGSPRVFSKLGAKLKKMTQHKTKLESYSDDPCSYMAKRSRKCLKVIATHDRLLPFINTQLEDSVQFLKQIKEKIPQLRERDQQIYQQLLEDKRNETEIQDVYKPLEKQIKLLQCSLAVYNVSEVRKSDFTDEELKCDEKPWESIIGDGSFSTVYSGVLSRTGQPKLEVALKRYREPLTTNNVMHFVDEERALRQLSHPNIVKFYGTNLQHGRNGTTVMIVLELCSRSLRLQVRSLPEEAPARLPMKEVLNKVLDWALNILDALRYIHDEGFAHRDLKLDNIFLAPDGKVKVADVGVAKHENEITGTVCSTSIYLAPEVYERRIYNSKSDMYSFGYVLWELWYGETAFAAAIESRNKYMVLEEVVKQDLRPTHIEGTQHPWGSWQFVMESCWNKDPKGRMTAQKGWEKLQQREDFQQNVSPRRPQPAKSSPPRLVPPSLRQQQKQEDFQQNESTPPLPPKSSSRRLAPPTKPKPATRREGKPVSYHRETEEGMVDFE